MLGSGIFVLPGIAAAKTGPSIWLAYLTAACCFLPAVFSKSELSSAMPASGGTYIFLERTYGPLLGTIAGIGLWLSLLLKSSFALIGFGTYLIVLADIPLKQTSLLLLIAILFLNIVGAKKVGKTQIFVVMISLTGLASLVLYGLPLIQTSHYSPMFQSGSSGFFEATALVFVSFAGVTKVAAIAEEIKNPEKTLPSAMIIALSTVAILYTTLVITLVGNIHFTDLATDLKPLHSLAESLGGKTAGIAVALLAILTMTSMANSGVLAASRFPFAMSRDNLLPAFFKHVSHKFLTPVNAILATGAIMAFVLIFLDVERIAKLASAFKVTMFILANLSVIILRETGAQWYKPNYRSPLYPWIQIFGILSGLFLVIILGKTALIGLLAITIFGTIFYYSYGHKKTQRSGVIKVYGRRLLSALRKKDSTTSENPHSSTGRFKVANFQCTVSANTDNTLMKEAAVVVPLFGNERSPETLIELGVALADRKKTEVVHISELPYQTVLDAMLEEEVSLTSLSRRVSAIAEDKKADIEFDAVVTHELVETVDEISNRLHCQWLVMGWNGRAGYGLLVHNPIGWLITHLSCNLALFKDSGIRYIRKILVYPEPGEHDELVATTADHLAEIYGAEITFMRIVPKDAKKENFNEESKYLENLCSLCKAKTFHLVVHDSNTISAITDASAAYDLLVTGAPHERNFINVILGTGKDQLTENAACSVLRLTTPRSEKSI